MTPSRVGKWVLRGAVAAGVVGAFGVIAVALLRARPAPNLSIELDVVYGEVGGVPLKLDVYRPAMAPATPRPTVLAIHGGGWVEGDKSSMADNARWLANEGYVVFSINYRLVVGDRDRYPAAALDVRRAARWARAHAGDYGGDPRKLGVVGYSAGGHLAALLGTTDVVDPDDPNSPRYSSRVDCVVDVAGPTDFTDEASPPVGPSIAAVIPALFGRPIAEAAELYRDASPVAHVDVHSAPTLIIHGDADDVVPVDQSRRFFKALRAAEVEARLVEFPAEGHGFSRPESIVRWLDEIRRFLAQHLKGAPPTSGSGPAR